MTGIDTLLRDRNLTAEGIGRAFLADYFVARGKYMEDPTSRGGAIAKEQKGFLTARALEKEDSGLFLQYLWLRSFVDEILPKQVIARQGFLLAYEKLERMVSFSLEAERMHAGYRKPQVPPTSLFELHRAEHLIRSKPMIEERIGELHSFFISMVSFNVVLECIADRTGIEEVGSQMTDLLPLLWDLAELEASIEAMIAEVKRTKADPPVLLLPTGKALSIAEAFSLLEIGQEKRYSTEELRTDLAELLKLPDFGSIPECKAVQEYKKTFSIKKLLRRGTFEVELLAKSLGKMCPCKS